MDKLFTALSPFSHDSDDRDGLPTSTANKLASQYEQLKWIIVDEVSLVSRRLLNILDWRLRQIKGQPKTPFGGVNVLFVGDLYQLRPTMGQWIIENAPSNSVYKYATNTWESYVKMYELHTIMRQKESAAFAALLNRVRTGEVTAADLKILQDHVKKVSVEIPRLCSTNAACDSANQAAFKDAVAANPSLVYANVPCVDTIVTMMSKLVAKAHEASTSKTNDVAGLSNRLLVYESQTVELTTNIDTSDGLTNGASGVLDRITWLSGTSETARPHILWVTFHNPTKGARLRDKCGRLRSKVNPSIPSDSTPIFVVSKQDISKNITTTRTQSRWALPSRPRLDAGLSCSFGLGYMGASSHGIHSTQQIYTPAPHHHSRH